VNELAYLFPPAMPLLDVGLLIAASLVTSFITAAFGIGGGVVLLAFLALVLPPVALIPVHGVVQLGSNGGRVAIMSKHVVWRPILPFVVGALIGAAIGGLVVVQLPSWLIQLALGIFIIWAVFAKLPAIQQRYILMGGAVSSFLTMFFGATGNFIAAMVKSMNLDPVPHVAAFCESIDFWLSRLSVWTVYDFDHCHVDQWFHRHSYWQPIPNQSWRTLFQTGAKHHIVSGCYQIDLGWGRGVACVVIQACF
jgi:hypothetical protein